MKHYNTLRRYFPELPLLPDPYTIAGRGAKHYDWEPPGDHYEVLHPIEERNVWHRIEPERWRGHLLRLYKRAVYERKRDLQRHKDEARAAKRHPPTNCRLDGHRVLWDPPNIEDGEAPQCYWIEGEERTGNGRRSSPPSTRRDPRRLFLILRWHR